jgi:hypothetical protein
VGKALDLMENKAPASIVVPLGDEYQETLPATIIDGFDEDEELEVTTFEVVTR